MSRVLCIFCMAYVHVHLVPHPSFEEAGWFMSVRHLLVDLLGRSSVPLLSMISGVLMVGVLRRRAFSRVFFGRARTLLVPMVVWNLIGVLLAVATGSKVDLDTLSGVLALSDKAFYPHLTFLRDVFVVSLATPALVVLVQRRPVLIFALCVVLLTLFDLDPLVLRDQIFIYYLLGAYVGVYPVERILDAKAVRWAIHISMGLLVVAAVALPFFPQLSLLYRNELFENLLRRPVCASWFWLVATGLGRRERIRKAICAQLEPAIFLMFLSHVTVVRVLGGLSSSVIAQREPAYYAVWLLAPIFCLAVAVFATRILESLPSAVSLLAVGRRTPGGSPRTGPGAPDGA